MNYFDQPTLNFLLHDVMKLEQILSYPRYQAHARESIEMFLDAIRDYSDKELFPFFKEMDEQPAQFNNGTIKTHPQIGRAIKAGGELGLVAAGFEEEHGGLQLPGIVNTAGGFIMEAANNHVPGYLGLTLGAAELITSFGSKELIDTYAPKMIAGEWTGTMCLTEPQAGSSLSDIVTSATPMGDGSYSIKGQKIFISGGDHEHSDNIIHLLLARIDGSPAGTKGISLFVVPKNRITGDSLEPNDVLTAGDFQKLGQKGYTTTHLIFGEKEDCRGWLVGMENNGLNYMFQMMNGARIAVGRGGAAITAAAYQASLAYAKERPQGRRINNTGEKDVSQEQTLIINHPDVRRMLMLQKSISEASLSTVLQAARHHDIVKATEVAAADPNHPDHAAHKEMHERNLMLLEILTPIVKTYPAEKGKESVDAGLQVLGGYGFCSEYILQQYYRDIRIFSIYEGTTGIQSIDLLGRKLTMKGGLAARYLMQEIMESISEASKYDDLKPYAQKLQQAGELSGEVLGFLMPYAERGEFERFLSDATIFMDFFSTIVIGWQWMQMAVAAKKAIVTGQLAGRSEDFYENKIYTLRYYFKYEMPKISGLAETIMSDEVLTISGEHQTILK